MSDETTRAPARAARRGVVEGVLGSAAALLAVTLAHASLPDPRGPILKPAPANPAAARIAAEPLATPMLIAFREPLPDGEVGSPFGLRQLPWEAHARLHAGVDIETPAPEPVLAAADGVVARMGEDPGYGRFVELTHAEGLTTLYGHLKSFQPGLVVGAAVKMGAALGQEGSTGSSTGAHLHFELHDAQGAPMNPKLFLGHAFATRADLPLKAGRRIPRLVRLAYVSRIPRSKQVAMDEKVALAAADGAADAADVSSPQASLGRHIVIRRSHHRVHSRVQF